MTAEPKTLLPELLLEPRALVAHDSLAGWLPVWRQSRVEHSQHGAYAVAIAAALQADRLAWAFFSGYQGALEAAFPELLATVEPRIATLAANETGRKLNEIATALDERQGELFLSGQKSWMLSGIDDIDIYVLARAADGPARGPGSLALVRVPGAAAGVERSMPKGQAMVPELPHCAARFDDVRVDRGQIVTGDGYADHVKPFRLREDVFVTGCTLAFLLAQGHACDWPMRWRQRCMAIIVTLGDCATRAPADSATELLVAGTLSLAGEAIDQAEALLAASARVAFGRWQRDKPILALGKDARRLRVQSAWAKRGWTMPSNDVSSDRGADNGP